MPKILKTLNLLLILLFNSQITLAEQQSINIQIEDIPKGLRRIHIPLELTGQTEGVSLVTSKLMDQIVHKYIYRIEKDENGNLSGLSIAAKNSHLEEEIELDLKIKSINKQAKEVTVKANPTTAFRDKPLYVKNVWAGFDKVSSNGNLRLRIHAAENTTLPTRLYIPYLSKGSITMEPLSLNWEIKSLVKNNGQILQIESINPQALEKDLYFDIKVTDGSGEITLGPVLKEPNQIITGIKTEITPSTILLNQPFKIKQLFDLE